MSFYGADQHSQVEGFIMKWTLVVMFIGVVLIFGVKLLVLLGAYITSGKAAADLIKYLITAIKTALLGG